MKKWLVSLSFLMSAVALAGNPVIYGIDNRRDAFEVNHPLYKRLAESTAARILMSTIRQQGSNVYFTASSLKDDMNVCAEARFSHQQVAADCSGVLVGPDLLVTAGHCMMSQGACDSYAWVFNYQVRNSRQDEVTVRTRDVYECKHIIQTKVAEGQDFAVIRLDRKVQNVVPAKVARSLPTKGTRVVTVGTPSGLPLKIADGAVVKTVTTTEFTANLDTFSKGSGSPVFNAETGELMGVLVRGELDYKKDPRKGCNIPNVLPDSSPGEGISSSLQFAKYLSSKR